MNTENIFRELSTVPTELPRVISKDGNHNVNDEEYVNDLLRTQFFLIYYQWYILSQNISLYINKS
jgi:hypothetical protein